MDDDRDFWALIYAAAIAWGHSNRAAWEKADQAVTDRNIRWHGEKETGDQG